MSGKLNIEETVTLQQIDEAEKTKTDPHDQEWLMASRMAHLGCWAQLRLLGPKA